MKKIFFMLTIIFIFSFSACAKNIEQRNQELQAEHLANILIALMEEHPELFEPIPTPPPRPPRIPTVFTPEFPHADFEYDRQLIQDLFNLVTPDYGVYFSDLIYEIFSIEDEIRTLFERISLLDRLGIDNSELLTEYERLTARYEDLVTEWNSSAQSFEAVFNGADVLHHIRNVVFPHVDSLEIEIGASSEFEEGYLFETPIKLTFSTTYWELISMVNNLTTGNLGIGIVGIDIKNISQMEIDENENGNYILEVTLELGCMSVFPSIMPEHGRHGIHFTVEDTSDFENCPWGADVCAWLYEMWETVCRQDCF
jgi:hypothetical protein